MIKKRYLKNWEEFNPRSYMNDGDISTLVFFEEKGFGNVTISQLIDQFIEYLNSQRRGARSKEE